MIIESTLTLILAQQPVTNERQGTFLQSWWRTKYQTEFERHLIESEKSGLLDGPRGQMFSWSVTPHLRDDNVSWNGYLAQYALNHLWPESADAIRYELENGDKQSRHLAADLLRSLEQSPSHLLIQFCVEELREPSSYKGFWVSPSASTKYLFEWYPLARMHLHAEIRHGTPRSQFLAAVVSAFSGDLEIMPDAIPVLMARTCDNDVSHDAKVAMPALYRYGKPALQYIEPYLKSSDWQQALASGVIVEKIRRPEIDFSQVGQSKFGVHGRDYRFSSTTHDFLDFDFGFDLLFPLPNF